MRVLGNILWFLFGGFVMGIAACAEGLVLMVSLIGIPFGLQMFKAAPLVFCPFGKGIRYPKITGGKVFGNVLWVIFVGWWNSIVFFLVGLVLCVTIIGIPFGKQWFKLARLFFLPFGAEVYNEAAEKKQNKALQKQSVQTVVTVTAPTSSIICSNCGVENPVSATKCVYCGKDISPNTAWTPSYSPTTAPANESVGIAQNTTTQNQNEQTELIPSYSQTNGSSSEMTDYPMTKYYADQSSPVETWVCPSCGKTDNGNDSVFCENCGYRRVEETTDLPNESIFPSSDEVWTCAACGNVCKGSGLFCGFCGSKREIPHSTSQNVDLSAAGDKWICPACGKTDNDINGCFCELCGFMRNINQ